MKSFLFTVENPHNLAPRTFTQRTVEKAIYDDPGYGPMFGAGHDLKVWDPGDSGSRSYSVLGATYANDTGIADAAVLTGGQFFVTKEVEVFEVMEFS
jgi:hypothetical protein